MIEQLIYKTIGELCNGQVYPLVAEEKISAPYIIYSVISGVKGDAFCGTSESKSTIQIDGYHPVYDELLTLTQNILDKIELLPVCNVNTTQSYESETKLYRIMIEVSIIH